MPVKWNYTWGSLICLWVSVYEGSSKLHFGLDLNPGSHIGSFSYPNLGSAYPMVMALDVGSPLDLVFIFLLLFVMGLKFMVFIHKSLSTIIQVSNTLDRLWSLGSRFTSIQWWKFSFSTPDLLGVPHQLWLKLQFSIQCSLLNSLTYYVVCCSILFGIWPVLLPSNFDAYVHLALLVYCFIFNFFAYTHCTPQFHLIYRMSSFHSNFF